MVAPRPFPRHGDRSILQVCTRLRAASHMPYIVVLLVISVAMTTGRMLRNEDACLREGGVCAEKSSCPLERTFNKTGLCPQQEMEKEAVCCAGLPNDVDNCQQHGGQCGDGEACRNVENFGQLDCEEGKSCCLLIF